MIGIIDYGAGNTRSIINSLNRLQADYILSKKAETLQNCDKIILPGVGHASQAMQSLHKNQLIEMIRDYEKPLLGICLGMQLLCTYSEEGDTMCLGITEDKVRKFPSSVGTIPLVGWNTMRIKENPLMKNITDSDYMYFIHSYYVEESSNTISTAKYGIQYSAAIQFKNYYGVQFHPEKSSKAGAIILQNFIEI